MNLPKRRSGRRDRTDCPGHAAEADGSGRDPEHAAYMNWVAATVGEHGWAISGRHGDDAAPPWAYSVGMWLTCQTPELVLCGLPVENAASIINAIGARIADGADFSAGDVLDDVCPAPLTLRVVEDSWRATSGLLGISDTFYGMVRPPYLQVVWPDKHGTFPWEPGFQAAFDRMQPLLWLHRDDNPPSPWTRLDHLTLFGHHPVNTAGPKSTRAVASPMIMKNALMVQIGSQERRREPEGGTALAGPPSGCRIALG